MSKDERLLKGCYCHETKILTNKAIKTIDLSQYFVSTPLVRRLHHQNQTMKADSMVIVTLQHRALSFVRKPNSRCAIATIIYVVPSWSENYADGVCVCVV